MAPIAFRIDVTAPTTHRLHVELEFDWTLPQSGRSGPAECVLFLPTWTPGSYLVREYSRHVGRVDAEDAATSTRLTCTKIRKNRWLITGSAKATRIRVRYSVYAHDLSVRTADVTSDHAYWNHACLLLWPLGWPRVQARIEVEHPPGWRLACALRTVDRQRNRTTLLADDLDAAIDAPCLLGTFEQIEWQIDGVPHAVVLDGLAGVPTPPTLVAELTKIVAHTAAIFGGGLPYQRYVFLCLFAAEGHGGLEHAESATLLMARTAMGNASRYKEFLALAAHELLHAWNVKRMRPVEFWDYDYEQENYTEMLWLIEGWTAYFDDLVCFRAGLMSRTDYLDAAAKNINSMAASQGRHHLSLGESSFDAWIRLYRPDENTGNSSQNYYVNGAVAAMCLDLWIRRESRGTASLDDVLRHLYASTFGEARGYTRDDVRRCLVEVGGEKAAGVASGLVEERLDPDLSPLLADFGLVLRCQGTDKPFLGVTFDGNSTTVAATTHGSPAHRAGISPGDEVLAIADLRVDSARWLDVFQAVARIDAPLPMLIARRGVILRLEVRPGASPGKFSLEVDTAASPAQVALRDGWLRPPEEPEEVATKP